MSPLPLAYGSHLSMGLGHRQPRKSLASLPVPNTVRRPAPTVQTITHCVAFTPAI